MKVDKQNKLKVNHYGGGSIEFTAWDISTSMLRKTKREVLVRKFLLTCKARKEWLNLITGYSLACKCWMAPVLTLPRSLRAELSKSNLLTGVCGFGIF